MAPLFDTSQVRVLRLHLDRKIAIAHLNLEL